MSYLGPVRQWDIFWADLDPVVGREQAGKRPVLVVSSDGFGSSGMQLAMAVPLTAREGKTRKFFSFEVPLPTGALNPGITPVALTQQLRAVSKLRLLRFAGTLEADPVRERIEDAVLFHLGIEFEK